ncbi:MAG: hypothetical protein ACERKD_05500 [Prolixibacteraceae bacterium]
MKTIPLIFVLILLYTSTIFAQRVSFSPNDSVANAIENQRSFRHMPFQFSFITPPLSTNGTDFYKTTNDLSVNTFLGISAGTDLLEVGGFANINLYYTNGIQVAGFANVTGIMNSSYESNGVQAAGFANICGSTYNGIQASGFANISKTFTGVQASGFMNVSENATQALQVSGFANTALKADDVFQVAGFGNIALEGKSKSQISGFGNMADDIDGIQAAGFINIAHKVKGVQLSGFINICDSIDGVAISFINLVKQNGYRSCEFSFNEWTPIQFTFKMGTKEFYNIYSLSKMPLNWDKYAFGFGFGHAISMGEQAELDLEIIHHQMFSISTQKVWHNNSASHKTSLLQFKPSIKRNIGHGVCLNFGPTLNFNYGYYRNYTALEIPGDIQPFWNLMNSKQNSRFWVGFSAGVSLK